MSRAATKARAAEPVKIDPAGPTPTPTEATIRGRASRPTFQRGGLVFGDREWTPIQPDEIGGPACLAIAAEPVITLQVKDAVGWQAMPAELRAAWADGLRAELSDTGAEPAEN